MNSEIQLHIKITEENPFFPIQDYKKTPVLRDFPMGMKEIS